MKATFPEEAPLQPASSAAASVDLSLCERPYTWRVLWIVHRACWAMLFLPYLVLSRATAVWVPLQGPGPSPRRWVRLTGALLRSLPWIIFLFCMLWVVCLAYPVWLLVNLWRRPYRISVVLRDEMDEEGSPATRGFYTLLTANLCCLPDVAARVNNLDQTTKRAATISDRIALASIKPPYFYTEHVVDSAPPADFVCLQEVFDPLAQNEIAAKLHKQYPYIIRDIGVASWSVNRFMLNSGLFFASKLPLLDVEFRPYVLAAGPDAFAGKGLLMVKVLLSEGLDGKRTVGLVYTTHLQAEHYSSIRLHQLDCIVDFTRTFRERVNPVEETIGFEIICGDFNFDNVSIGIHLMNGPSSAPFLTVGVFPIADSAEQKHPIFEGFVDPSRAAAGIEHPKAMGSCLESKLLRCAHMSTPEQLKIALLDPDLRGEYVEASVGDNNVTHFGARRIDFILHSKQHPCGEAHHATSAVEPIQYLTAFAGLTDHIPLLRHFTSHPSSDGQ